MIKRTSQASIKEVADSLMVQGPIFLNSIHLSTTWHCQFFFGIFMMPLDITKVVYFKEK